TQGTGRNSAARQRQMVFDALGYGGDRQQGDELSARDAALVQELWLGPASGGRFFSSPEGVHEAGIRLRGEVMAGDFKDGRRPLAWWQYDARDLGLKYPGDGHEQSYLFERGVLREDEVVALMHHWRLEFDATYAAGLSAAERRARFRDIDLPELLRK